MRSSSPLLITCALLATACPKSELATRVDHLEQQVAVLAAEMEQQKAKANETVEVQPEAPAGLTEAEENEARALLEQIASAMAAFDPDQAKTLVEVLETKYPNAKVSRYLERMKAELAIMGKDAGDMDVIHWYQGKAKMDDGDATLLVFWEKWCPHCQREMPKLEATFDSYQDKGLNLVGLTKANRGGISDGDISDFIGENSISYPMGKENNGSMSAHFGVRGVPAAALVQDGVVIWRGHPARITDAMLNKALE